MKKLLQRIAKAFAMKDPRSESKFKLHEARFTLVEHKCALEFYRSSVPMLEARIARLQSEIEADEALEQAKGDSKRIAHAAKGARNAAPALGRQPSAFGGIEQHRTADFERTFAHAR
ncbi:hypothetical protein [Pararobbsia silviterrae]|uniref:Uncharacterized protein n=1 Tax=Pararobbsia silviterrae TaxID=1792498 RepID=A0A494X1Z7_9BURK|nr:hypothetical protein [Pararobbsia silviterrae]RKP44737.1 hypothetical protein D7S86_27330 [Pararobbsia silviterrae]